MTIVIKKILPFITIAGFLLFMALYKFFFYSNMELFPKCFFKMGTGYECPGCGSQRSIHYLLNLEIGNAFRENPLLIIAIPYLLIILIPQSVVNKNNNILYLKKALTGKKAIGYILFIICFFWLLRNIFPAYI